MQPQLCFIDLYSKLWKLKCCKLTSFHWHCMQPPLLDVSPVAEPSEILCSLKHPTLSILVNGLQIPPHCQGINVPIITGCGVMYYTCTLSIYITQAGDIAVNNHMHRLSLCTWARGYLCILGRCTEAFLTQSAHAHLYIFITCRQASL